MKLTETIRNAFVRAIMADVPSIDYVQRARDLVLKAAVNALPPKVRAAYDDEATRPFVEMQHWSVHGMHCFYCRVPGSREAEFELPKAVLDEVRKLHDQHEAQEKHRDELKSKLRAVAMSVTTRKALAAALPEFEKYLPADDAAANRSLPCVQNVVADLVAAGWPKETP